ncbi:MAG TPA: gluconate 2-dehydrogenase subunit 3 family protein [Gemmatimonadales bacterium]|nr:gluconate 2-dehydrogenase subunit 3 family protein [Gemmatimonadales bacterium]
MAALDFTTLDVEQATRALAAFRRRGQQYQPRFFTPSEWEAVRLLVDIIIPADERSGSATQAGVPEFMDFIMTDSPGRQTAMRGGLAWLDTECRERFGKPSFVACTDGERRAVLDDIAWPARARPELSHGVAFFNSFRDLTASGFWSSKMGVEDLRYIGNTAVPDWNGCADAQLRKLGVSYE